MSFFLSLCSMMTVLMTKVEWIWDFIEIPVYESIEDYRYLPEARLYIDGVWMVDAEAVYTRNGVERTFISTVNTSIVRNYTMYYRVTFPDYYITQSHPIIFSVVDTIPPTIFEVPEKTMMVGGNFPQFEEGVRYQDNYDEVSELSLSFQITHITKNVVGTYHYGVIVTDQSGNQTKTFGILHVLDLIPPLVSQKKSFEIDVFSTWNIHDYFSVTDNADPIIDVMIEDENVDYTKLGDYPITITWMDDSRNMTKISLELKIVDRLPPSIILVPSSPIIDVLTPVDITLLRSFVLGIEDNYDVLKIDDIEVMGILNTEIIGTYRITYRIKDSSQNLGIASLDIKVLDRTPPIITLQEALIVDVFSIEPFWIEYFDFYDAYSIQNELTYQLTTKPKMDVIGFYPLTLSVTDKSGNKAIYQGFIEVVDRIPPTIEQLNDIVITDFERHDYRYFFKVSDQYDLDEQITIIMDDHLVDYTKIGLYSILVIAKDQSGNQSSFESDIWIVDIVEPTLKLTMNALAIEYGNMDFNAYDLIDEAYDNYDILSVDDVVIEANIDWMRLGKYTVIYQLTDVSGNQTKASLIITIDDYEPPMLIMEDLIKNYGDPVDLYEGITLFDNTGSPKVYCLNQHVDEYAPGQYVLTYVVMDQRGNYRIYERTLYLYPTENHMSFVDFFPLIIITLLGVILSVINYRYYK